MAEESTRTKMVRETKVDDDMPFIKKAIRSVTLGGSKLLDKMGITQEEEYKDKSKEELAVKKRAGGVIKAKSASARADGCAQRGKTRGKIV